MLHQYSGTSGPISLKENVLGARDHLSTKDCSFSECPSLKVSTHIPTGTIGVELLFGHDCLGTGRHPMGTGATQREASSVCRTVCQTRE